MATQPAKEYPGDVVRGTFFEHDVPISQMFVHLRTEPGGYARPLRPNRVNKLVKDFDRQAIGVLLLSMRADGTFAIIDGQHRCEVCKHFGIETLDAFVYIDLTLEDEARLYRKFGDYLKQTALDRYHAGIAEGKVEYLAIRRILNNHGLHIPNALGGGLNTVDAVDALVKVTSTYGLDNLDDSLSLLHDAWGGEHRAYRSITIIGTAAFLARFKTHPNFRRKRLVSRMEREGMSAIERRAMSFKEASLASNANHSWGQALLATHEHRAQEGQEMGEWIKRHLSESGAHALRQNFKAMNSALTPQQRSDRAVKGQQALGLQGRSDRAADAWKTRMGYSPKDIGCPHCGAVVGAKCEGRTGRILTYYHQARSDQAAFQSQKP